MSDYPAGAANDSNAPYNSKANDFDLSHLCPSCDDVRGEANEMISEEQYETTEEYEQALEDLIDTASFCKPCYRLDQSEY